MSATEQALRFACEGEQLTGIVSAPLRASRLGVVIVVGGPQYRAGSHRQFVLLARALAAAGFAVLRFDCRGMGDSTGALRDFEHITADISAAISALQTAHPSVQSVVLWGLCDGASAALLYLHEQPDLRVAGLALLNPWVRSEASLARTHVKHYYLQRLKQLEFWRKLLRGQVAFEALAELLNNVRAAIGGGSETGSGTGRDTGRDTGRRPGHRQATRPYQQRMAQGWAAFDGPKLLLLSELDLTAREFTEFTAASAPWQQALRQRPATRVTLAAADHTCSTPAAQRAMETATAQWLATVAARCTGEA